MATYAQPREEMGTIERYVLPLTWHYLTLLLFVALIAAGVARSFHAGGTVQKTDRQPAHVATVPTAGAGPVRVAR